MTLRNWIAKNGGPVKLAPVLGVTSRAVNYWLEKKAVPTTKMMVKIHQLSKRKVSYESIILETIGD